VSPRSRVVAITAASAAIAAAAVVGVVALQTGPTPDAARGPTTRPGSPPLTLVLGVRTDREARALRRAAADYRAGRDARAVREFARWRSIEARVGEAFARWPDETVDRLNRLAGLHPDRAVVQLNLGVALYWSGLAGAEDAWRQAAADEPDTAYAVAAGNAHTDACDISPALLNNVMTVGATKDNDSRDTSYSNYGKCVNIFAPGTNIKSASNQSDSGYALMNGTSMASPHVAGAAALVLGQNPKYSPAQVARCLKQVGTTGKLSNVGSGSPNLLLRVSSNYKGCAG